MQNMLDMTGIRFVWAFSLTIRGMGLCLVVLLLSAAVLHGQQTDPNAAPVTTAQMPLPAGAPADAMSTDWANLMKYAIRDSGLPTPTPGIPRVVFMGDSITEAWKGNGAPSGPPEPGLEMINRGISGQTTPQMVLRFRQDVIDLKPDVVVILAGTNDIAGNTGPMTPEETEDNLAAMAQLAHANGIRVVLCSILPTVNYPWKPGGKPALKVIAINSWIKQYATEHGYVYVDFHSAMADDRGGLPPELSRDGVHPTKAGFAVMTPMVTAGIEKALAGK